MNFTTLAVSEQDYKSIIDTLEHGYNHNGISHRPNHRVAFALKLEYATGMRISDIVKLRQRDIVKDGDRYRLDIIEKKTGKKRTFRISQSIYDCIDKYCAEHKIPSDKMIIGTCEYAVQKQLKYVREYLGIERCSTHSLRKSAAMRIYKATGNDIVATQLFLQHSSSNTTAKYLTTCNTILEEALDKMAM